MNFKAYIRYLFLIFFLLFVFNKFYLRPWVLKSGLPHFFELFVYSLPNFIEAVYGTLILVSYLFILKKYFSNQLGKLSEGAIYLIATLVAAIYVITQELKIHNLGGRNIYDPYDVLASCLGLISIYVVINRYGFLNELS